MARKLSNDQEIDDFIAQVQKAALAKHGANVRTVIKPLSQEVRKRFVWGRDEIAVLERNGKLARTCWVTINGARYVFSFDGDKKVIQLKPRSTRQSPQATFDNSTSAADIQREVARL
jgi:hypothetical protein